MSILSASSAFTLNAKSQGLFSSHTAFKKPTFNTNFNKSSNGFTILSASAHPKDLALNQKKAVKICSKSEDSELIMCEPAKKVKLCQGETLYSESLNNKTQQHTVKSSRLTIEEVFHTPFNRTQSRKGSLIEDCFDEGSSLSFISSHSSFDNLDDESVISRKNSDCIIIGAEKKTYNTVPQQSLVVKDDVMGRLSYLNQEPMLFNNWKSHSVFDSQDNLYQPALGYMKLPVDVRNTSGLGCKGPLCMPPLNEYIQFTIQNQQSGMSLSDKVINELVKGSIEDGYDSDSYATRSTSIEQETGEKGSSPTYSGNEDLYVERKVQQNNKQKVEKVRKQGRSRATTNTKEKKGRSLNLKLDLNPKQIKVQRRLNRLQLLRYQQGTIEEEHEDLKQFGIFDLLSRGNSTIQESDDNNEDDDGEYHFDPEYSKAIVPELGEKNLIRRVQLTPTWNPENLEEEKFEEYLRQLEILLENPVSDIEAAIKLLTSHGMDISLALEDVKQNVALYSEVFRLKVKRLRRRGA